MSRRILLADDSLTIQKVVELTFADTEYEVIAVSSGDDLLAKLPEAGPEIVICDVIMPGRDGYDVCQEIKSNPDFLHLPVVLLTGTFEPFDRDRALAVGCSEIITKPFEAKRLVEAVEQLTSVDAAARQPSAPAEEAEEFEDGRVTPPPPFTAPEEPVSAEVDYDLEDTAVTAETETVETTFETPGDGLEFTKSGFQAMEEAGLEQESPPADPPSEGIEFTPEPEPEVVPEPTAGFVVDPAPAEQPEFESTTDVVTSADEPFSSYQAEESPVMVEPVDDDPFPAVSEPEPERHDEDRDHEGTLTTPINVDEVMGEAEEESQVPDDFLAAEPEPVIDDSNADTKDFGVPPAPEAVVPPPTTDTPALSDKDVDRIARRVLELSGEKIDTIAWEVLPDMAEIVVRERVREIEAEAETQDS